MASVSAPEPSTSSRPATAADFEAFDSFPWSKHRLFLLGLIETLGGPDALRPNPTHEGSATFCRIVFFRRQTGRRIDLTQYNDFRSKHPDYPSIDRRLLHALYTVAASTDGEQGVHNSVASAISDVDGKRGPPPPKLLASPSIERSRCLAEAVAAGPPINPFDGTQTRPADSGTSSSGVNVPSWQHSAPRSELRVVRESAQGGSAGSGNAGALEAPYSDKFAKVVEAIQSGKELEGIKQIPDIVVRQAVCCLTSWSPTISRIFINTLQGITPIGKLRAPRKPWERAVPISPTAAALPMSASSPSLDGTGDKQFKPIGSLVDMEFPELPAEAQDKSVNSETGIQE
ncbi:hypothetical protein SEPCBS119000_001286 [Sporothrix epigloea]|uniref:Uncharacterized protein n=1 Tax=Sporothrix epigloea TaxID=1892477 RepID=A0ABP0DA48_9PEZI